MESFHEYVGEYKKQLEKGVVQKAYKGLMEFILDLRGHFQSQYPNYFVSGSIYFGYMDMTYFSIIPKSLKERQLKIAIVFIHDGCRFETWLAGTNKHVQSRYWNLFKESGWTKYHIVPTTKGVDSILEHVLTGDPDFRDPDALTRQIETAAMTFVKDVESFLAVYEK